MRPAELARMFDLEDRYWWFVARRELVNDLLARGRHPGAELRVLDVGCGTGATLKTLDATTVGVGIDRSAEALRYCQVRKLGRLVRATAEALPIASESVDVVLALDLLEHVADDGAAARELARVLRPGGVLLLTVPACPELWSEHDEALDHLRRYRAARLRRVLRGAKLRIEKLSPLLATLLIPIAVLRLIQRILPKRRSGPQTAFIVPPRAVNALLIAVLRLERRWLRRFNLPAGVSLVAVARKT